MNWKISIKENSWIAKLAARKLGSGSVAIVIGKTIHLHNVSRRSFLKNEKWVKHELCHIRQYRQQGLIPFVCKYLWESLRKGYYNNKYEIEARRAEEEHLSETLLADLKRSHPDLLV